MAQADHEDATTLQEIVGDKGYHSHHGRLGDGEHLVVGRAGARPTHWLKHRAAQAAVSAGHDCVVRVWGLVRGRCLRTLNGHKCMVSCVSVTPDGRRVVSGSWDETLRVWDMKSGVCLQTLATGCRVLSVCVTPDGQRVISGNSDSTLRVWDLESEACTRTLEGHRSGVRSVSATPDGRRVVSGSHDDTVREWDLESGACLRTLGRHSGGVTSMHRAVR